MTYFRVSQQGILPSLDVWVSNFHVQSSNTLAAVHTAASSGIASFWNNTFKPFVTPGTTLTQVVTTELDIATGKNKQAQLTTNNIAGTGVAPALPNQDCVLISLRTANAGKSGRGRQYLPTLAIANLATNGTMLPATRDAIDTAYQSMLNGLASTGQVVILHGGYDGRVNGVPTYKSLTSDNVTSVAVATKFATQRRRINKVQATYSPFLAIS